MSVTRSSTTPFTESTAGDSDSESVTSDKAKRVKVVVDAVRYRWTSELEFVASTLACISSVIAFDAFVMAEAHKTEPCFIHHFLTYTFVGLPVYYMQIVLGQYTQLGTITFKYMSPIGHGIGFAFIVSLFLKTIRNGLLLPEFIFYFLSTMHTELQWMECPEGREFMCWTSKQENNCTKNCINEDVQLSAFIFFTEEQRNYSSENMAAIKVGIPPLTKAIPSFLSWMIIGILLVYSENNFTLVVRKIWTLCISLVLFLIFAYVLFRGNIGFITLFSVYPQALYNPTAWYNAMISTSTLLGLGRAFHIIHGSFMSSTTSSTFFSIVIVYANFLLTCGCSIITQSCLAAITYRAKLDTDHIRYIYKPRLFQTYFVLIPQGLGLMGIPQLWTGLYFLSCILMLLTAQLTHLRLIELSLIDAYPTLKPYRKYVLSSVCLLSFFIGILLISKESVVLHKTMFSITPKFSETFNCMMMCVMVCWMYGVRKYCDNIHFLFGAQPAIFWKICWYLLPLVLTSTFCYNVHRILNFENRLLRISSTVTTILAISVVPLVGFVEVLRFAKKRNLLGLFKPEERFGPPDPKERMLRKLFNPRKETRSKRRSDVCAHRCFLGSKIIKRIVAEENKYLEENVEFFEEDIFELEDN